MAAIQVLLQMASGAVIPKWVEIPDNLYGAACQFQARGGAYMARQRQELAAVVIIKDEQGQPTDDCILVASEHTGFAEVHNDPDILARLVIASSEGIDDAQEARARNVVLTGKERDFIAKNLANQKGELAQRIARKMKDDS